MAFKSLIPHSFLHHFYTPVSRRAVLCDWVWRAAGRRPHRFPHNNFSSVYRIFTKLGHMIPLSMKGKNPIYFGSLGQRSRSLLPHDNFSSVYWIFTKHDHMIALWKGKNPIYFGVILSQVNKVTITINRIVYHLILYIDGHILWCTHFLFILDLHEISINQPYLSPPVQGLSWTYRRLTYTYIAISAYHH